MRRAPGLETFDGRLIQGDAMVYTDELLLVPVPPGGSIPVPDLPLPLVATVSCADGDDERFGLGGQGCHPSCGASSSSGRPS